MEQMYQDCPSSSDEKVPMNKNIILESNKIG